MGPMPVFSDPATRATNDPGMKAILIMFVLIGVIVPAHMYLAEKLPWWRTDIPDFYADTIANSCIDRSLDEARVRLHSDPGRQIETACRCIARKVQEEYYLEEYLRLAGLILLDRLRGGDGDQNYLSGGRLPEIEASCLI